MERFDDAHPDMTEDELNSFLLNSSYPPTDKVTAMSLTEIFKIPENSQFTYATFTEKFERYKVQVDLLKWLIGTVGLTLITYIINWGFKDREQGMDEISQYDRYATELIVLNDNPVNKRMLAQFFSRVTPSENLKKGWLNYYNDVNAEYKEFLLKDSLAKLRLVQLLKKDTTNLSNAEKVEKSNLEVKVVENEKIRNAPIITPDNLLKSTQIVYMQSINTKRPLAENIKSLLANIGFKVPAIEFMDKDRFLFKNTQIKYFRESDISSVNEIKLLLSEQNIETTVLYLPNLSSKAKQGTIEIWLK